VPMPHGPSPNARAPGSALGPYSRERWRARQVRDPSLALRAARDRRPPSRLTGRV
jgi:hypothetical protein